MDIEFLLNSVDDCIFQIYKIENNKNITFYKNNDYKNLSRCFLKFKTNLSISMANNLTYNYNETIYIDIYDRPRQKNKNNGYINITLNVDEYIFQTCELYSSNFLDCKNCNKTSDGKLRCDNDQLLFYKDDDINYQNGDMYKLEFNIQSKEELNCRKFNINNNFYTLSQKKYNFTINYKDDELELINFNSTDNFYRNKNPNNLTVNYKNYYFKVYFINTSFNGSLLGLNLNNDEIILNSEDSFIVNELRGLKYKLSPFEKISRQAYLSFEIQAFNNPKNIIYSESVSKKETFKFYIKLEGDHLLCLNKEQMINSNIYFFFYPDVIFLYLID